MARFLFILMASFLITLVMTPFVRKIALRLNITDKPVNALKIHMNPVPYLGGLSLFLGITGALILAMLCFQFPKITIIPIELGLFATMVLGVLDDILDIKASYKFGLQLAIAFFFVFSGFLIGTIPFFWVSVTLSVLYVVGACNALNLLDGLDGLACGSSAISSVFFFGLFLIKGDNLGIILSLCLLGACLAFLFFNFEPARIFMGDAGSTCLGFMLAILMIKYSSKPYNFVEFTSAILVCGVPVFDTGLAYLRRYVNKRPIFSGDRSHFYDQLVDKGLSIKQTVFISYAIGGIFGSIAIVINFVPSVVSILILAALLFSLLFFVVKMRMLKMEN